MKIIIGKKIVELNKMFGLSLDLDVIGKENILHQHYINILRADQTEKTYREETDTYYYFE